MRLISEKLLDLDRVRVLRIRADVYHSLMVNRIGVAGLSAVSLLALFLYLRQAMQLKRKEFELKRRLQVEAARLEDEVHQRTAELTALTTYLQTAREDERNRLARNLHDDLGSLLTSAKLDAARMKSRLTGVAPEALVLLAHLVEMLNSSIALGRSIIEDLRPSSLSHLGLLPTLEIFAREFSEQNAVTVATDLKAVRLSPAAELMVYRLVQEALTNITKYANARHVEVRLSAFNGRVTVTVRDDGVGFDPQTPRAGGYGLLGMRFRVEAEGGQLQISSAPGHGTQVQVTLPEMSA